MLVLRATEMISNFTLTSREIIGITLPGKPTPAEDRMRCALLTIAMHPEDLKRLVTWTMPFGKYKGRLLADLPGHYLTWFAREGFPAGQLGQLLALMHELDHNGLKPLLDPLREGGPSAAAGRTPPAR